MKSKKQIKVEVSRQLRENQTEAEEKLWWMLRNRYFLGHKFRRQHIIDGFILDFYCPRIRLGIELDGDIHLKQRDYDNAWDRIIKNKGIKIIRFRNSEVFQSPDKVIEIIVNSVKIGPLHGVERGDPDEVGVGEEEQR